MLGLMAVANQESGRREFTSNHVACTLGATPDELGLWARLDLSEGVPLCATLAKQTDKAPAQYQFKHLSFQEGLYAEYLLGLVRSLQAPKPGWWGWKNDEAAAAFLNNRYMANTCRIAAGHLGSLLAQQRQSWNFTDHQLTPVGRQALWFIGQENSHVAEIYLPDNNIDANDVVGLSTLIATCKSLKKLDLRDNSLFKLLEKASEWQRICDALAANRTLT
eukprot:1926490-Prymnesium_polylepis.1